MRVIVISDLHFGVPETSVNDRDVRFSIIDTIKSLLPIERIILLGDILDLNLARLGDSVDGASIRGSTVIGFRQFLRECLDKGIRNSQWVYIPGNHDYDIFDVPARLDGMNRRFLKKVDEKILCWAPRPWEGRTIAPQELQRDFMIQYPHRWEKIGTKYILLTHGHYLDPSQTLGKKIEDLNKPKGLPVDKFFALCAQYQSLTRAISYQGESIKLFGNFYKYLTLAGSFIEEIIKYGTVGLLRGKAMDLYIQRAALAYIKHFGPIDQAPDTVTPPEAMIFGHTHKAGMVFLDEGKTANYGIKKGILLVNDGGFIHSPSDGNTVGSFVEVDSIEGTCKIRLHVFERPSSGKILKRIEEERSI